MTNDIQLWHGQILNNAELVKTFKCSPQGGMRKSNKTNSLILISNHVKSLYDDKWENEILYYVGTGRSGNQSFNFRENKTLYESNQNGITVHLFEVFQNQEYTYQGIVRLASEPYFDKQPDKNFKERKVCIFPLKLVKGAPIEMNPELLLKKEEKNISKLYKKVSNKELKKLVEGITEYNSDSFNSRSLSTVNRLKRDKNVVLYTLRRANGICQLCNQRGPFLNKEGIPFLEVHHIKSLSNGGSDTLYNTVALCPNCHRKMHINACLKDVAKLKKVAQILLNDD